MTTYTIGGAGSDYSDLQTAFDDDTIVPGPGETVELQLQSGYSLPTGTTVENFDYSAYEITSAGGATVNLVDSASENENVFTFKNCRGPRLNCLIDCKPGTNKRARNGIYAYNSTFEVGKNDPAQSVGIINVGSLGLSEGGKGAGLFLTDGSIATAQYTNWSGAANRGAWITRGCMAVLDHSNFSSAGIEDSAGNPDSDGAALFVSRGCVVHADHANLTSSNRAIRAARCLVSARYSNLNNAVEEGIYAFEQATVTASNASVDDAGASAIYVFQGGAVVSIERGSASTKSGATGHTIHFADGVGEICIDNCPVNQKQSGKYAVLATTGTISASNENDELIEGGNGVQITDGATLRATQLNVKVAGNTAVYAQRGGHIYMRSGTVEVSNSSSNLAIRCRRGGMVWAESVQVTQNGSTNSITTSDTNVSAFDALTGNGVVFN